MLGEGVHVKSQIVFDSKEVKNFYTQKSLSEKKVNILHINISQLNQSIIDGNNDDEIEDLRCLLQ